jgi:hypothetical protein
MYIKEKGSRTFLNKDDGGTMKKIIVLSILVFLPLIAYAGEKSKENNIESGRTPMVENRGGSELKPNEYEVISTNGAITRATCPYTCGMRGLEAKHCKTWRSLSNPKLCYVQDTRLKSDAIDWGGSDQGK